MQDLPAECREIVKANQLCEALGNMMLLINSTLNPDEIMQQVMVESAKAIGCESARIAIRENNQWALKYIYNLPEDLLEHTFTDEELPHASLAMITKKVVAIEDAFNDSRTNIAIMKELGIRSVLVTPLLVKEKVIGSLFFNYHTMQMSFDRIEMEYAGKISTAIAIALRDAIQFQQEDRTKKELAEAKRLSDALSSIEASIYSSLDTDQIMKSVLRDATSAIGAETAMIFSKEGKEWRVRYVHKLSQTLIGRLFSNDEVRHTAITAVTHEPLAITDAKNDTRTNHAFIEMLQISSLLDFPLLIKGEVIGDLVFHYHSRPTEFTQEKVDFVKTLQSSISLALENARLFEALKESDSRLKNAERLGKFGYFHYDRCTGKMTWSDGLFAIFGRDPSEGEPSLDEIFHHYCADPNCSFIVEQVTREELSDFELTIQKRGENVQLRILVHSLEDGHGNTCARLGTAIDVTEQKRAQQDLKDNEAFKQAILDCLSAHIVVIDEGGNIIGVNRRWLEYGRNNGELVQTNIGIGVNYLAICRKAADQEDFLAREALEGIEAVLKGARDSFTLEYPCPSPDSNHWFLMKVNSYSDGRKGAVISHLDITGRKLMEEELRQSKEGSEITKAKLEAVIQSMNDALVICNEEGNLEEVNPAAVNLYRLLGIDETLKNLAQLQGVLELSDAEGKILSSNEWPIKRALRGETFSSLEIELRNIKSGATIIGSYSGTQVIGRGATALGMVTIRDVTQQKQAIESLRRSENNYRAIFDSASDAIFVHDAQTGKVLDVNQKMLEMYKYSREEARHLTVSDISGSPNVSEEKVVSLIQSAAQQGPNVFPWLGKDKDGNLFWVEVSLKKVTLQGADRVLAIVRDITERKKAEEELIRAKEEWESTFNSVPDLIAIIDDQMNLLRVNRAMAERLGRQPEELMGMPCYKAIHRSDEIPEDCPHAQTVADGREHHGEVRDSGGHFFVSTTPLIGSDGKRHGTVHVARDITEQKRAAEQIEILNTNLLARTAELEAVNRELESFSYTVAHDLRNPLNIINGNCQLLEMICLDKLDEKCREFITQTHTAAIRMNQLITALLDFSRIAQVEVQKEKFDLSAMAHEVAEELKHTAPERSAVFNIADGMEVNGDPALLRIVLDNLMGNAWKYTKIRETAMIEVGATANSGETAYFVRDNGSGFDMADYAKLFVPFKRLTDSAEFKGFGIGLATVARIISRHGGRIWAEGEPDKGASFYFTLP